VLKKSEKGLLTEYQRSFSFYALDIGRKKCTEAWACLSLNQLRYKYPYHVSLLLGRWAVLSC
jgi:hypothetical protein